jgi:hypothetical protein
MGYVFWAIVLKSSITLYVPLRRAGSGISASFVFLRFLAGHNISSEWMPSLFWKLQTG